MLWCLILYSSYISLRDAISAFLSSLLFFSYFGDKMLFAPAQKSICAVVCFLIFWKEKIDMFCFLSSWIFYKEIMIQFVYFADTSCD